MFQKAHYLFTLLCGGSTAAIIILVSLLYLHVSENSLRENQFRSFQNDINTITAGLEDSSLISIQWLERIEALNGYRIYVMDNGVPFLYNSLRNNVDQLGQTLLNESLYVYHDMSETTSAGISYSGIWHTEYQFTSSASGETYYSSLIDIRQENAVSQIVILRSQQALYSQITGQRLRFLGIDCGAVLLLFAFAWFFTGRLLRPLKRNHEAQTQFIAAASHELRTPLSVILASSECCESAPPEEQKGFFQTIRKEGRRMHHLIDDMLTLAHSGSNHFPITCSDVQLDTLCLNAYEAFESLCRGRNQSLHLILPDEVPPRCNCDADRIAQVLSILLHNAISYTPDGDQITLTLQYHSPGSRQPYHGKAPFFHKNNGCFKITVADTGIGISDEDKKHIFDRFYRAEKSRSTKEHFGLGLSIAQEIVAAHHGRISVEDNPGGGSVFGVWLMEK
ncbi:MAG: HAMP domain-containing histidine kinase [Ruminococcus sp.]|nr:HAMP domain-containing histidine kinase [Ruminococcus sp.]